MGLLKADAFKHCRCRWSALLIFVNTKPYRALSGACNAFEISERHHMASESTLVIELANAARLKKRPIRMHCGLRDSTPGIQEYSTPRYTQG